jgi:hypothetical protein
LFPALESGFGEEYAYAVLNFVDGHRTEQQTRDSDDENLG